MAAGWFIGGISGSGPVIASFPSTTRSALSGYRSSQSEVRQKQSAVVPIFYVFLTTLLVARFERRAIEDRNVAGMLKNREFARRFANMGFGEFRRQLEYQAGQRRKTVIVMNRWYASYKNCSAITCLSIFTQTHAEIS
ncbi:MAG: hypothetical protein M1415_09930 [Firmicutes bacterium]|jgi:transposase|nr:hypothetical protein [Bacillota bacterium]MCL5066548.1 hypothetical protein [Bacillota bacterium]